MKTMSILTVSLAAMLCVSCSAPKSENPSSELVEPTLEKDAASSKPDMKAMFGPDYQKGDIGHSTGLVTALDSNAGKITIDHGKIHGTSIEAAVSAFETLPNAEGAIIALDDKVEFLIKKGSDDTYRLLQICAIAKNEKGCL